MTTANDKLAFDFLVGKGLTDYQAAGVIGNLLQESNNNPTQGQIGGGPGRGIAQWEKGARWDQLVASATAKGQDPFSMQAQLDFLWKELSTIPYLGLADLKATTSVEAATTVFCNKFERPRLANMPRRISLAKGILAQFGNPAASEANQTASEVALHIAQVAIPIGIVAAFAWHFRKMWKRPRRRAFA